MNNNLFTFFEMQNKSLLDNQKFYDIKKCQKFVSQIKCGDILIELQKLNQMCLQARTLEPYGRLVEM